MHVHLMDCPVDYHDSLSIKHFLHSQLMDQCSPIHPLQGCVGPSVPVAWKTNICSQDRDRQHTSCSLENTHHQLPINHISLIKEVRKELVAHNHNLISGYHV